jgi:hypothetical protein
VVNGLVDIKVNIKIFMPIASPATMPKMLVGISYAHVDYSASTKNTVVAFDLRVFQIIVFILREAMVKDEDS